MLELVYLSMINALLFLLLSSSPDIGGWRRAGLLLLCSCAFCVLVAVCTVICGLVAELAKLDTGLVLTTNALLDAFEVRGVRDTSVPLGSTGICGEGETCCSVSSPFSFLMSITNGCGSDSSSSSGRS